MALNETHPQHPEFLRILKQRVVEQFFIRLNVVSPSAEELLIVSPVLGTLEGTQITLGRLRRILQLHKIRTVVLTRSPEDEMVMKAPGHRPALETLGSIDGLEIRYNDTLHAKIYICTCRERRDSFAVIGSPNMTKTSIERNIEVGLMIRYAYEGQKLIDELENWVKNGLRLQAKMAKPMVRIQR